MTRAPYAGPHRRRTAATRAVWFVLGVGLVWGGTALLAQRLPVDITAVLLVLLALVVVLALLTGPTLGVVASFAIVVLVNWYLVPPYGTLEVGSSENVVALVVFPLVAAISATLVEVVARARAREARGALRAELLADLAAPATAVGSLERIRRALDLDTLVLLHSTGDGEPAIVETSGATSITDPPVLDVEGPEGFRLRGYGVARMAEDPAFLRSLVGAAVAAHQSRRWESEVATLSAVDEARAALLASIGHDLRTPLSGLRLAVDTLRSPDVSLDEASRDALLATAASATRRLDELISNLLDLSRLEAGSMIVQREAVALDGVVGAAVMQQARAAVDVQVADDLPLIEADPVLLERVVENLVSNAVRHGRSGPGRPALVRATPRTSAVVLDVVDHGPGLPAGRATSLRPPPGAGSADSSTGLGLAIVRSFCAAMDVGLELRPTEGGGLTARLTLRHARGARS